MRSNPPQLEPSQRLPCRSMKKEVMPVSEFQPCRVSEPRKGYSLRAFLSYQKRLPCWGKTQRLPVSSLRLE